jgi:hypothetical protein
VSAGADGVHWGGGAANRLAGLGKIRAFGFVRAAARGAAGDDAAWYSAGAAFGFLFAFALFAAGGASGRERSFLKKENQKLFRVVGLLMQ